MDILLVDQGLVFDGLTPSERALGGAESAFIALAEAFAAEGCGVTALASGARRLRQAGVDWRPLGASVPAHVLCIANRNPRLLAFRSPGAQPLCWLHNPAQYLRKPRFLWPIIKHRPRLVVAGPSHAKSLPWWLPARRVEIPLGVEAVFLSTPRSSGLPRPRLVWASNPLRGLEALVRCFAREIRPRVPEAELWVYGGPEVYASPRPLAERMRSVLLSAAEVSGVVLAGAATKPQLALGLAEARVMAYPGDPGETFCLAVAEAQAMGVPCVVGPEGAVHERVKTGISGFRVRDLSALVGSVVTLLTDDQLWRRQSAAALLSRPALGWQTAAHKFLGLVAR